MKLSARFTEFGLVGAFFLIALFIVALSAPRERFDNFAVGWATARARNVQENLVSLRESSRFAGPTSIAKPSLALAPAPANDNKEMPFSDALGGALGVVAVFVTGLLLDILSFIFFFWDMFVFHKILKRYEGDFIKIMDLFPPTVIEDYKRFLKDFDGGLWMGFKHPLKRIKCYFCYGRCFSFFIAYAGSGEMPLDVLGDYLRVWRTVRGIGVSAALLAGIGFAIHAPNFSGWQGLILPILVFAIVLFLSMVIVGINFNRLSASLLASVWVVARKDEELKAASIDEVKKSLKHRPPKQLHGSHGPAKPATLAQMLD